MRKEKFRKIIHFAKNGLLYPFFFFYLNSFLYGIGYLCERMISLRGDMSAENNEKH